ncbi:MAG: phosphatidylcholine/phosphatidylserine synthase [Amaricoccus sp.]|uniref:CDP-alcohol phosphatidyltransferase family protein n=1 Tax=Amaricoccus sp. TaxID=1872485 RepID=UPI0039E6F20C
MPDLRRPPENLPFLQLVPNLVTILGLCAGLTAIRFAFLGRFDLAAGLIVFAAVIDGFDGLLARKLDAASPIGAELDSLADFVDFGVAPAIVVYFATLSGIGDLGWTFALVFAVCCCLRLARFNVNRDVPLEGRAHFVGVPAPAGALLGLLPVFATLGGVVDASRLPWAVAAWLGLIGLLMVSRLKTFSPKALRIPRERSRFILVAAALLVGLTLTRFWLLLIVFDVAYAALLVHAAVVSRRQRR